MWVLILIINEKEFLLGMVEQFVTYEWPLHLLNDK
jgi:hypothetical protein